MSMSLRTRSFLGNVRERPNLILCYDNALDWIRSNTIPGLGVAVSDKQKKPYPEITGYLIPTLIEAGELDLAEQYADSLSKSQLLNGAFLGPNQKEYFFDCGQALRGLVCAGLRWKRFWEPATRTADYMMSWIESSGRIPSKYGGLIPEAIHVYALPPLAELGRILDRMEYVEAVKKSIAYYRRTPDTLSDDILTHFVGYVADGFIELGEQQFVRNLTRRVFSRQRRDGSIPAYPGVKWICAPGLAQLAVVGYKLGMFEPSSKAIDYLCTIQNPSGGFYGSYGSKADYFADEEIGWAIKFFLDSVHMKISSFFNLNADIFPQDVAPEDGRLREVLRHIDNPGVKAVLDAGCGKGRFASKIKEAFPSCEIHGVDISAELLKSVPDSIVTRVGSVLNLPYPSQTFDFVFSIEVLEHAIRAEKAVDELCRVLKDGGRLLVIDKNIEKMGRLRIADFEQWFDKEQMTRFIGKYCYNLEVREIAYDSHDADGLFLAWSGMRRTA